MRQRLPCEHDRALRAAAFLHVILIAVWIGGMPPASAQETNVLTGTDYPSFRIISERNIFNAGRTPGASRSRGEPERRVVVESVALVGTMSYEKGTFAVFDGTQSDFRKVLKELDSVAGHQVVAIRSGHVVLAAGDRRVELKVGQQLSREDEGPWEVRERSSGGFATTAGGRESREKGGSESGAESGTTGAAAETESGGGSEGASGGASEDEVLKRLLEKRAKETNP